MAGFFHALKIHTPIILCCILLHFHVKIFMKLLCLKLRSSLVEHIVENYWSKFDVTGKQMNVQLE